MIPSLRRLPEIKHNCVKKSREENVWTIVLGIYFAIGDIDGQIDVTETSAADLANEAVFTAYLVFSLASRATACHSAVIRRNTSSLSHRDHPEHSGPIGTPSSLAHAQ